MVDAVCDDAIFYIQNGANGLVFLKNMHGSFFSRSYTKGETLPVVSGEQEQFLINIQSGHSRDIMWLVQILYEHPIGEYSVPDNSYQHTRIVQEEPKLAQDDKNGIPPTNESEKLDM